MKKIMIASGKILTIGALMFMSVPSVTAQELDPHFMARYDLDFDGKVTKAEFRAANGTKEKWAEYDLDNNGNIEGKELPILEEKGGKKGKKGK
ncbi:hypothetical protein ACFLZT_00445 [Thermodesulfobacteriota bacterium]